MRLALVATVAGAFSGLFGVGGGTVIVPLLIIWFAYEPRVATGTSLLAIAVIATFAASTHGAYGSVDVAKGVLIGLPAIAGVVAGTWLQQRVPQRVIAGIFALVLVASAISLVV